MVDQFPLCLLARASLSFYPSQQGVYGSVREFTDLAQHMACWGGGGEKNRWQEL